MLMPAIFIAVPSAVGLVLVLVYLHRAKRRGCGLGIWARRRLRREGERARAIVLDVITVEVRFATDVNLVHHDLKVVFEVTRANGTNGRVNVALLWPWRWLGCGGLAAGASLPVLIGPGDPPPLMIDYPTARQEQRALKATESAADADRQRALLDQGRRR